MEAKKQGESSINIESLIYFMVYFQLFNHKTFLSNISPKILLMASNYIQKISHTKYHVIPAHIGEY